MFDDILNLFYYDEINEIQNNKKNFNSVVCELKSLFKLWDNVLYVPSRNAFSCPL